MHFFGVHGRDGVIHAEENIENGNQVRAFKQPSNGIAGAGKQQCVSGCVGPHLSQYKFAESAAVERNDLAKVDSL